MSGAGGGDPSPSLARSQFALDQPPIHCFFPWAKSALRRARSPQRQTQRAISALDRVAYLLPEINSFRLTAGGVSEPATLALFGLGLAGLGVTWRRAQA